MRHLAHLISIKLFISRQMLSFFFLFFIKCSDKPLVCCIFACKFRTALRIFPEIIIISQKFPHYVCLLWIFFFHKIQHDLIPGASSVLNPHVIMLFIILPQILVHLICRCIVFHQRFHYMGELSTIIVDFHHFFNPFQLNYI